MGDRKFIVHSVATHSYYIVIEVAIVPVPEKLLLFRHRSRLW